jgi:hypothetical protein
MKRALLFFLLIPFLAAQTRIEVQITSEPSHHLVLEKYMRVVKVEAAPRASTLMHRHRHGYVSATLGDAHASNEVEASRREATPTPDERGKEFGEIRDSGSLGRFCGDGRPARRSRAQLGSLRAAATSVSLRALDQRIPRRNQADPMQLGGEAVFVGGG